MTDNEERVAALLKLATEFGHVGELLEEVDSHGQTPLELARSRQFLPVVKMARNSDLLTNY